MPGNARLWMTVLLLAVLNTPALAQEPEGGDDSETPSLELLEFLGGFETEDGEWIDPQELEEIALGDPEQEYEEETQK